MSTLKASVLIVEDDALVLLSFEQVLKFLGYRVRTAKDGIEAVVALREEVPDILVSDLQMPRMSGFELLSVVSRRFPQIRAIAMSGAYSSDDVASGMVVADAFFQKGNGVAALIEAMEAPHAPNRKKGVANGSAWIHKGDLPSGRDGQVTMTCRECFRTFPAAVAGTAGRVVNTTTCIHCDASVPDAVEPLPGAEFLPGLRSLSLGNS